MSEKQYTQEEGAKVLPVHPELDQLFTPLSEQDKQTFDVNHPESARICFAREAAIIIDSKTISVCLNDGSEFVLSLPSFFTVVVTANALVPLLLDPKIVEYSLLQSTGFTFVHIGSDFNP